MGTEAEKERGRNPLEALKDTEGETVGRSPVDSSSGVSVTCKVNRACCRSEVNNQPYGRWVGLPQQWRWIQASRGGAAGHD